MSLHIVFSQSVALGMIEDELKSHPNMLDSIITAMYEVLQ